MKTEMKKDTKHSKYMEELFFADPKINAMLLRRATESIESALKDMKKVTTFGQTDKYDDRDEIINQQQSLNQVSRYISQAITKLEQ